VKLIRELRAENARLRALLGDAAVTIALFLAAFTVLLYKILQVTVTFSYV